jgi:hypothetical protein
VKRRLFLLAALLFACPAFGVEATDEGDVPGPDIGVDAMVSFSLYGTMTLTVATGESSDHYGSGTALLWARGALRTDAVRTADAVATTDIVTPFTGPVGQLGHTLRGNADEPTDANAGLWALPLDVSITEALGLTCAQLTFTITAHDGDGTRPWMNASIAGDPSRENLMSGAKRALSESDDVNVNLDGGAGEHLSAWVGITFGRSFVTGEQVLAAFSVTAVEGDDCAE